MKSHRILSFFAASVGKIKMRSLNHPRPRRLGTMQASARTLTSPRKDTTPAWPLRPFDFHTPTRVVFGPGSMNRLGELARDLGDTRVLLVTDPGLEAAGHPQRATQSLKDAGLDVFLFDNVEENPTSRHVEAGVEFAR